MLWNCHDDPKDTDNYQEIINFKDKFFPVQKHDRNLYGLIHGSEVKEFNSQFIKEFAEDYEGDDELMKTTPKTR